MKPTTEEFRHWHHRVNFTSLRAAAMCCGVKEGVYKRWYYGDTRAPACFRRLMQYVERFGSWDRLLLIEEQLMRDWLAALPQPLDRLKREAITQRMIKAGRESAQRKRAGVGPGP